MKLIWAHSKANFLEMIRIPGFWVPMLTIPIMLYLFFGVPEVTDPGSAAWVMVRFAALGVLGLAFFQFGVFIANDRESNWEVYLRTLPVAPLERFIARLLVALVSELIFLLVLFVLAALTTPVELDWNSWILLTAVLLIASIPFGTLGIALGYWVNARSASAIANVLWISLAYVGGVWGDPAEPLKAIMPFVPTRFYIQAVASLAPGQPVAPGAWLGLLIYAVCGMLLAVWGYRRDEGRRYC